MGLDMYLNARRFYWYDEEKLISDGHEVKEVIVRAIYWRKANAIHKWFVDILQNGEDDCGTYYVGHEELESLRDLCKQVLGDRSKAEKLLPTQSGFFFGGTDYDEWYFNSLEDTVSEIDRVLEEFDPQRWDFEYHSSW